MLPDVALQLVVDVKALVANPKKSHMTETFIYTKKW